MKLPANRRLLIWLFIAAVAAFAVYQLKFAPVPVLAHTVVQGELLAEVMGTGTLEARVKTTISARIQERLAEVLADQGDRVKAGQLLARLDDAEAKQQVAIAAASLAAAKQTAERVRSERERSDAVLGQARLDHRRSTELLAGKIASEADYDRSVEALRVAESEVKRSTAAIAEAEGQIVVAEKNHLFRQEQLAFTEIHSPYDGLIIRRDREPGEILVPGASLMQLISLGELWVSAWVDETALPALATDQPARILFRSEPGRSFPGKVSRLGREMDRETREFLVDVRVNEMPKNWTLGQRAEVFIETGQQSGAVLLPSAFLLWKSGRAGVFVNAGGKAQWREVTPGSRGQDHVAIVEGLNPGEQVVRARDGQKAPLTEGQRLQVRP